MSLWPCHKIDQLDEEQSVHFPTWAARKEVYVLHNTCLSDETCFQIDGISIKQTIPIRVTENPTSDSRGRQLCYFGLFAANNIVYSDGVWP